MKLLTYFAFALIVATPLAQADESGASQCRPSICEGNTISHNQQKILYQALRMVMADGHNDIFNSNPPTCDLRHIRGNTTIKECLQVVTMDFFDAINVNKKMWEIKGKENCIVNLAKYSMPAAYDLRPGPRFDSMTGAPLANEYTLDALHAGLVKVQSAIYCQAKK